MTYKEDNKMFESISKHKVKCKCGHVVVMASVDRMICNWCGRWIYRTPGIEFRYKMIQKIRKDEKNEKENR